MRKLWILGLESLETRYTGEWYTQFTKVMSDMCVDFQYINGEAIKMDLKSKFFLDPVGTNIWKVSQMYSLLKRFSEIGDEDVIFTWDFWHPSLECLAYARSFMGAKFKIAAIAHAGTYDPWDLTYQIGMGSYGKFFEEGWFSILDAVFVATNFHKDLILKNRTIDPNKIYVTGLPVDCEHLMFCSRPTDERQNRIVFTGRKSTEKGFELVRQLKAEGYPIIIGLDLNLTKKGYHDLLGSSKIVFAPSKQETFGYGVVEGALAGCIPVVPDALSFKETVIDEYRYQEWEDVRQVLDQFLQGTYGVRQSQVDLIRSKFDYPKSISEMITILRRISS